MKKLQSRVRFKIKGLNQERAFNKLTKDVQVLKLVREDKHTCEIEVAPKDSKKTKKFFESNNFEILKIESFGAYKWGKWFLSCYGLIFALTLCCIGFLAQKNFIWQIRVLGNDKLEEREITEFIDENLDSRFIGQINTKQIEILLKDRFERISSVSVAIVGQCLVVNINESVLPDEVVKDFQPIICNEDCRITDIELIQGTLAVNEGDIVRKGDVLVYPYIIDSQGQKREVKAMAKIRADVWIIGTSEHFESYYRTYRTGKTFEQSRILLFGMEIYSHGGQVPFKQFEMESKQENLNKNNILPFKLHKEVYYELKTELIESKFEDLRDEIIENAHQNALQKLAEYEIIKEENYTVNIVGGVSEVTYVITVSREIVGG